jgi:hypothetical protein
MSFMYVNHKSYIMHYKFKHNTYVSFSPFKMIYMCIKQVIERVLTFADTLVNTILSLILKHI